MMGNIVAKKAKGFIFESVCSGMKCHDLAMQMLLTATPSSPEQPTPLIQHHSACDSHVPCRDVLRSFREDAKPEHLFADVLSRLRLSTRTAIDRMLETALQEFEMRKFAGEWQSDIVADSGPKLLDQMYKRIRHDGLRVASTCVAHGAQMRECCHRADTSSGRKVLKFVGLPCISFSTRGLMMDLLHGTCKILAVVLAELMEDDVDFSVMECTVRLDTDVITTNDEIIGKFDVRVIFLSPTTFGHPYSRERCLVIFREGEVRHRPGAERFASALPPRSWLERAGVLLC